MIGGTAYVAGKAGQRSAQRQEDEAEQEQPQDAGPNDPDAGQTDGTEQGGGAPAESDLVAQLTELKGLLDSGALTDEEFQAAKAKLLA
jgi:hypothetical protein